MVHALFLILAQTPGGELPSLAPRNPFLFAAGVVLLSALPGMGCGLILQSIRGERPLPAALALFMAMVGAYLWPGWTGDKHPAWGWGIAAAVLFGVGFHLGVQWRLRRPQPQPGGEAGSR